MTELRNLRRHDIRTIGLVRVIAEVLLMVVLGDVERFSGADFRDNLGRPDMLRIEFADDRFGRPAQRTSFPISPP